MPGNPLSDELLGEIRIGPQMDAFLAAHAIAEPKASGCGSCDLGMGTRGMDRCSTCDGTGSVFRIGARTFPNTEDGYVAAAKAKIRSLTPNKDTTS